MKTVLTQKQIHHILARTDWKVYWKQVAQGAEQEINAYDEARRRSLARAGEKVLR